MAWAFVKGEFSVRVMVAMLMTACGPDSMSRLQPAQECLGKGTIDASVAALKRVCVSSWVLPTWVGKSVGWVFVQGEVSVGLVVAWLDSKCITGAQPFFMGEC